MDDAITRLRCITDRVEQRGDEVEDGPAMVRLLGVIEHVEAILDRDISPEIVDRAIQHLEQALHWAACEVEGRQGCAAGGFRSLRA